MILQYVYPSYSGLQLAEIIKQIRWVYTEKAPYKSDFRSIFPNLQKEAKGIETNEQLYKLIQPIRLHSLSIKSSYLELINKIKFPKEEYFKYLLKAMKHWVNLFQ